MNRTILVLGGTTLLFGSASAYLWQQHRDSDSRNVELAARVQDLESKLAAATRPPLAPVANPFETAPEPAAAPKQPEPVSKPAALTRSTRVAEAAGTSAAPVNTMTVNPFFNAVRMDKLMEDPEYREAMRTQQRLSMNSRYPDLGEALNLAPDQVDKLLDMLADQEIESMGRRFPLARPGEQPDQATLRAWNERVQNEQKTREAQLTSLLGPAGMQDWNKYQQSLGARMEVKQMRGMLEASDPIRPDQVQPLVDAIAAEQRRSVEAQMQNARAVNGRIQAQGSFVAFGAGGNSSTPADPVSLMERSLKQTEESHKREHDAVAPYLSPRQLKAFDSYRKQQLAMQRASLRMMRARAEAVERGEISDDANGMSVSSGLVPLATP